ncbi:Ribosomal RNA small subunit methyltransferase I [Chromobacterium violaceum]|uniref:Ribosomal RNA small subunit methyltransferase I n=1 Tax=Chromobacterium violaceum TaxID=536 RepID=A0A447T6K3_CHRVL|nr:Ribosomal RNA small subunit methyltransferase I [Chromobacterium violaceum]
MIAALSASGFTAPTFLFHGFLPPKSGERRRTLQQWLSAPHLTVCYEAPHRIVDALQDIVAELGGERRVMMARELTKTFETFHALPAAELLEWVRADANQQRGEIALIIDAAPPRRRTPMRRRRKRCACWRSWPPNCPPSRRPRWPRRSAAPTASNCTTTR